MSEIIAEAGEKKILICGGAGFIGSHFVRYLHNKYLNYKIFNFDLLTYAGNLENLIDLASSNRYQFIKGDICDTKLLNDLFEKHRFDIVVNFAAETHVDRSIFNSVDFIHTNVEGVHSLLEVCRKYGIRRFVQISTDEVYGDVKVGFSDEDAPLRPSSPYSASKAAADLIILSYVRTFQFPAVIVRGSNNFGPYQYPEKLIPLAVVSLLTGKKIPTHGTGEQVRNWLHVWDFCSAIDAVTHKAQDAQIFNASNVYKKNIEVLEAIAKVLKKDLGAHKIHTKDRPGGDGRYAPDSAKIRRELGWSPRYSFDDQIGEVVSWYLDNREWWTKILNKKEVWDHYQKQFEAQYY